MRPRFLAHLTVSGGTEDFVECHGKLTFFADAARTYELTWAIRHAAERSRAKALARRRQ